MNEAELSQGTDAELKAASVHHDKTFRTVLDAVEQFYQDPLSFASTSSGSAERLRSGMKRRVEYLELNDGSGPILVVEVYTK